MRRVLLPLLGLLMLVFGASLALQWALHPQAPDSPEPSSLAPDPDLLAELERGRYLAILGNCRGCHTRRGGPPYAGGRPIPTPFGTFHAPNITPDPVHGIGAWSADDFWHALHEGRSRDGKPLYPVFPYTNYTKVTRSDSDALYHYLRSIPAMPEPNRAHDLRFPYGWRPLLVGWRLLYFRSGIYQPDPARSESWNRGAYLVEGLGHCSACHAARNALGAVRQKDHPAGGLVLQWYAPSLHAKEEAGVQGWAIENIVRLLADGYAPNASVLGPMAEVTFESLQHWREQDLRAMAVYLASLPDAGPPTASALPGPEGAALEQAVRRGEQIYRERCAECHGDHGQGRPPLGTALARNRAVLMGSVTNPVRIVLHGGYLPGTGGNPRPYGMPPFGHQLSDQDIAAVLTYVRRAWGNEAQPVSPVEVRRHRGGPLW